MAAEKTIESDAVKNRNELIAGMVAGFVCKIVEYPLDTVKVQVQTQSRWVGERMYI